MKKIFKVFVVIISMFMFTISASAVENFSCDYSFQGKNGTVKFRVRGYNVDISANKYSDNQVTVFYEGTDGSYHSLSGTTKNYKNSDGTKLKVMDSSQKKQFLKYATNSGSIKCPNLYVDKLAQTGLSPSYTMTFSPTTVGEDPYSATPPVYNNASTSLLYLNSYPDANSTKPSNSQSGNTADGNGPTLEPTNPAGNISEEEMTCEELLGPNLTKLVSLAISVLRIAGMIIAIINASLAIMKAVSNPDKIKDAKSKCVAMGILLVVIGLFKTILVVIGNMFGFDLSCF